MPVFEGNIHKTTGDAVDRADEDGRNDRADDRV
jgi:hypothetical protein